MGRYIQKKKCIACKRKKSYEEFTIATGKFRLTEGTYDGFNVRCTLCHNAFLLERRKKMKALWVKEYNKTVPPEKKKEARKRRYDRLKSNKFKWFCTILRTRVRKVLKIKGFKKVSSFSKALGCDPDTLRMHLESQFKDGMTWENYGNKEGNWSIDHIIPISTAKNVDELYKLSHYTNLQPMWHIDNIKKGCKIPS
jgi:hypothetical protein